jgi:hypothetical protein
VVSRKIKALICFVIWGIVNEDTPGRTRSKLMQGCCAQVGIAATPNDLKMLVGRHCVVDGNVRVGGSDGFCWKQFNKYVVVWMLSTQYCGSMEA